MRVRGSFLALRGDMLQHQVLVFAEEAALRLEEWSKHLRLLAGAGTPVIVASSFLGRELRAAAVVAACAEVERFIRETLIAFSDDLGKRAVRVSDLQPSLRALALHKSFQTIKESAQSEKHWNERLTVSDGGMVTQIAEFPARSGKTPQPPLDGRTIRPYHLALVWKVMALPGTPFVTTKDSTSFTFLAQIRNDVAHGNALISEVFHDQRSDRDNNAVAEHIDAVALSLLHWGDVISDYMKTEAFLI